MRSDARWEIVHTFDGKSLDMVAKAYLYHEFSLSLSLSFRDGK